MESNSPEKISFLITSKLRGTISAVDKALLDHWLEQSDERKNLFKEMTEHYEFAKVLSIGYFSHRKFQERSAKLLCQRLPEFSVYQSQVKQNNTKKYIRVGLVVLILLALLVVLFIYPGWFHRVITVKFD